MYFRINNWLPLQISDRDWDHPQTRCIVEMAVERTFSHGSSEAAEVCAKLMGLSGEDYRGVERQRRVASRDHVGCIRPCAGSPNPGPSVPFPRDARHGDAQWRLVAAIARRGRLPRWNCTIRGEQAEGIWEGKEGEKRIGGKNARLSAFRRGLLVQEEAA